MRLTYETGVATMIQFIALSLLNIATGAHSIVTTCQKDGTNCVSNIIVSLIFYMVICGWFAAVWMLGVAAQTMRNKRLAQLLILTELLIASVAIFNVRHRNPGDYISLITSLIDLALAIWIIVLATRLIRARGGRVVNPRQARKRPTPRKRT